MSSSHLWLHIIIAWAPLPDFLILFVRVGPRHLNSKFFRWDWRRGQRRHWLVGIIFFVFLQSHLPPWFHQLWKRRVESLLLSSFYRRGNRSLQRWSVFPLVTQSISSGAISGHGPDGGSCSTLPHLCPVSGWPVPGEGWPAGPERTGISELSLSESGTKKHAILPVVISSFHKDLFWATEKKLILESWRWMPLATTPADSDVEGSICSSLDHISWVFVPENQPQDCGPPSLWEQSHSR